MKALEAFYKVMELEPEYKEYCISLKANPDDFLIPIVDYFEWKKLKK